MSAPQDTPMGSSDMDYPEHERTYSMFVTLVKYAGIGIVLVVIALAIYAG